MKTIELKETDETLAEEAYETEVFTLENPDGEKRDIKIVLERDEVFGGWTMLVKDLEAPTKEMTKFTREIDDDIEFDDAKKKVNELYSDLKEKFT